MERRASRTPHDIEVQNNVTAQKNNKDQEVTFLKRDPTVGVGLYINRANTDVKV